MTAYPEVIRVALKTARQKSGSQKIPLTTIIGMYDASSACMIHRTIASENGAANTVFGI
jgi:hypothetical protein